MGSRRSRLLSEQREQTLLKPVLFRITSCSSVQRGSKSRQYIVIPGTPHDRAGWTRMCPATGG